MTITKSITPYPTPAPNPLDRLTFNERAAAKVAHDVVVVSDINVWTGQANLLRTEVNQDAQIASQAAISAKFDADRAEGASAVIPEGSLVDGTVSPTDGWTSKQIFETVNGVNNPVNLEYDSNDVLVAAVYEKLGSYLKQQLIYTNGTLTSVDYSISDDNATFTLVGTETLNYDNGKLISTTWSGA